MLVVRKKATRSSVTGGGADGVVALGRNRRAAQNSLARNINFMTKEHKSKFDKLAE